MSVIDTLITDRDQADLTAFNAMLLRINTYGWDSLLQAEKDAWYILKATYNPTDYNRVGNAMIYLRDLLNSYGYFCTLSPTIDWLFTDVQTTISDAEYIAQLNAVKSWFYNTAQALPVAISSLEDANKIEAMLVDINSWIELMIDSRRHYAGTFYTGEDAL